MKLKEVINAFLSDIQHEDRTNLLCAMLRANLETKKDTVINASYKGSEKCEIVQNDKNKFIDELKDELASQESALIDDLRQV